MNPLFYTASPLYQFEIGDLISLNVPIAGNLSISLTNIGLYLTLAGYIILIVSSISNNSEKIAWNGRIVTNQINEGKSQNYFPLMYSLFALIFNRLFAILEYCTNGPPKPHAFVSIPLESSMFKSLWLRVFTVNGFLYTVLLTWLCQGKFMLGQIATIKGLFAIYYIGGCCLGLLVLNTIFLFKSGHNLKREAVLLYLVKYVLITVSLYLLREQYLIYFPNPVLLFEQYSDYFPKAVSSNIIDLVTAFSLLCALPYLFSTDLYMDVPDVVNMKAIPSVLMADRSQDGNTASSSGTNNNYGSSSNQVNDNSGNYTTQPTNTSQVSNITISGTNISVVKDGSVTGTPIRFTPSGRVSREFCATHVPQETIPLLGPDSPSRSWAVDKQNLLMDPKFQETFNDYARNQARSLKKIMEDTDLTRDVLTEAKKNNLIQRISNLETNVIRRWWLYEEAKRLGLNLSHRDRWNPNHMQILIEAKRFRDNLP